jgi:hypothetical protein
MDYTVYWVCLYMAIDGAQAPVLMPCHFILSTIPVIAFF